MTIVLIHELQAVQRLKTQHLKYVKVLKNFGFERLSGLEYLVTNTTQMRKGRDFVQDWPHIPGANQQLQQISAQLHHQGHLQFLICNGKVDKVIHCPQQAHVEVSSPHKTSQIKPMKFETNSSNIR